MGVYDRIKSLCEQNGTTVTALEKALGFGRGSIGKLKDNRKPSYERVQKIAHALQIADQYTMKMGGWRTDNVMKRHYRQTLTDVEKQAQAKLDAHALKLIKGSAGHETGHDSRKVQ